MEKILIVEDELIVARDIRVTLEKAGYKIAGAVRTAEKALAAIEASRPSLVLVDIFLKGPLTGIDLATHLDKQGIPFIYVSANSDQPVLEAAKTTNPYGFVVKPFRERDLLVAVDIARYRALTTHPVAHPATTPSSAGSSPDARSSPLPVTARITGSLIGRSAPMLHVFQLIQQVAPYDTSVLLLGDSGTGKEGVANAIFRSSPRHTKPFIKINCAAIPPDLMGAELFGYEKGAFTGAYDSKPGKFELAAGGTMLLDEIGEMSLDMQARLLRVLQEKEIQRIGGHHNIRTNVRIIAATSRHLEKEVGEGKFRLDLYYRLLVFPITLPPLRQRREDIPLLVQHFIDLYASRTGRQITGVSPQVMQKLMSYDWPGNVRELQHLIERHMLLTTDSIIAEIELPENIRTHAAPHQQNHPPKTLEEMERAHILEVLKQCNFRITGQGGAAEMLRLSPATLHNKLKKLGISKAYKA